MTTSLSEISGSISSAFGATLQAVHPEEKQSPNYHLRKVVVQNFGKEVLFLVIGGSRLYSWDVEEGKYWLMEWNSGRTRKVCFTKRDRLIWPVGAWLQEGMVAAGREARSATWFNSVQIGCLRFLEYYYYYTFQLETCSREDKWQIIVYIRLVKSNPWNHAYVINSLQAYWRKT